MKRIVTIIVDVPFDTPLGQIEESIFEDVDRTTSRSSGITLQVREVVAR